MDDADLCALLRDDYADRCGESPSWDAALAIERLTRERDEARAEAIQRAASVAREYWTAVVAGHGHIPVDPVEAMTKAAQEIEAAILWVLTTDQRSAK